MNAQPGSAFNNTQQVAKQTKEQSHESLPIDSKDPTNGQSTSHKVSANIDVVDPTKEGGDTVEQEVVKEDHVCSASSHEAMHECQVCGLFCHASCVSNVGSVKMCADCFGKRDHKTNGNSHMPRIQEMANKEREGQDDMTNQGCDTADDDEEEDEDPGEDESKANRGCVTSKLNEVLSS